MEGDESKHFTSTLDNIADSIYAEFGVPADAAGVDVLSFRYKLKNGEPVAKEIADDMDNLVMKAFVSDEQLFLTDLESKYAFSLSEMRTIRTVKKSISLSSWNKEIPPKKGIYKPYKIKVDKYECIYCKPYHILELEHNGEIWGIYFPCYELPIFESLTGLSAE